MCGDAVGSLSTEICCQLLYFDAKSLSLLLVNMIFKRKHKYTLHALLLDFKGDITLQSIRFFVTMMIF